MKRTENYYDRYELYEEINYLCGDDDSNYFTSYSKMYVRETSYDTYTGSSDDYWDWN